MLIKEIPLRQRAFLFLISDKVLRFCEIKIAPFKTGSKSYIIYQIMDDYMKGA